MNQSNRSSGTMLTVIEQKEVDFYGDEITAVLTRSGEVFVPIRPICDHLGINWDAQRRRIQRDPVLNEVAQGVVVMTTPSSIDGRGGGEQEMTCLPLKYISGWLFGISANRVKEALRDAIIRYQRECYDILSEAFQSGYLAADSTFDELLASADADAVEAYHLAQSVLKLARSHIILSGRIDNHEQRLASIEARLGDKRQQITTDQAARIQAAVKTIAYELGKRSSRNEFGGVWAEFYRKFEIPDYRSLPHARFEEALTFLRGWWESITDSSNTPF